MSRKSRAETAAALAAADSAAAPVEGVPEPRSRRARLKPAEPPPSAPGGMPIAPAETREVLLDPEALFPSPLNPRHRRPLEGLRALALSLIDKGQEQAIMVRTVEFDPGRGPFEGIVRGEIIFGTRRHAAFQMALAGLADDDGTWRQLPPGSHIRALVRNPTSDREVKLMAADENLQREDMDEIEEAHMFVALRDEVEPRPGESWEYAVARLFPGRVAARTVQRRRALLDCVDEVQQALIDRRITNAQALAFAMGTAERQRAILAEVLDPDAEWDAADIKTEMREQELPEVERALFDPALYTASVTEDLETGEKYFADVEEFERLQSAAFEAKAEELRASGQYRWVDIDRRGFLDKWTTHIIRADDPDAGAVLREGMGGGFDVVFPALRDSVLRDRQQAAHGRREESASSAAAGDKPPAPRLPLTQPQIARLHEVKTQALRRALTTRNTKDKLGYRAAIVAAILGLSGAREIRGMGAPAYEPSYDRLARIATGGAEQRRREHLLKTAALPMHPRHKPRPGDDGDLGHMRDEYNSEHAAAWFDALMQLPDADLMELFALTVAEHVGSWVIEPGWGDRGSVARLGDSPLAVAIAAATDAVTQLDALWKPDRAWFLAYPRERLAAIVRDQLSVSNADQFKTKAALADICADQPAAFWRPSLFPELVFQPEDAATEALDGPLPPVSAEAAE